MSDFDVVIVGTGVAGQSAAEVLSAAGKRVAMVDRREYGGTCALRGCEPKKVLYSAAESVERAQAHIGRGTLAGSVAVDWPRLMEYKRTFTTPVPAKIEKWLAGAGATLLHGDVRFVSADAIEVDGATVTAEHYLIATGAKPLPLGMPGEELVMDSETFMDLSELPSRIVFIGGGFISFEFAHMAHAAGAKVTIVHRGPQVLKGFDADLSRMLADGYRATGIDVLTDAPVASVSRLDGALAVTTADGLVIECDAVVHGAGRVPDLDGLELDLAGVEYGPRGIAVDERMCALGNPRVYAAGDAAALGPMLTPVGIAQARIAARNIIGTEPATFAPDLVPSVVFSDPPMASVGLNASKADDSIDVKLTDTTEYASTRRECACVSAAKILAEKDGGRIVGAHLLGPGAPEVINTLAVAISCGLTADDLRGRLWAYPTHSSEIVYLV